MPIEHMKIMAEIEERSLTAMRYQIEEAERKNSQVEADKQALEGLKSIYMVGYSSLLQKQANLQSVIQISTVHMLVWSSKIHFPQTI